VNLSKSHSERELGTQSIYVGREAFAPETMPGVEAWVAQRPVTNTVCAVLYRRSFLAHILAKLEDIPTYPVVPIDWKLNRALMNMNKFGE